jgi:peptide/nickel transport system permease protein
VTLPALTLGLLEMGLLARITRSSMLEVLGQDYIRTARAKGQARWKVIVKHALRNVVVPVVTVIGIITSSLVSGSVVIETVFSLPGVGRLVIEGIQRRDYPIIQGGLLVTAVFFVLINLIVDLLYHRLDPRLADPAR